MRTNLFHLLEWSLEEAIHAIEEKQIYDAKTVYRGPILTITSGIKRTMKEYFVIYIFILAGRKQGKR